MVTFMLQKIYSESNKASVNVKIKYAYSYMFPIYKLYFGVLLYCWLIKCSGRLRCFTYGSLLCCNE